MVLSGCREDGEHSWEYGMVTGCVNRGAGKSPSVHSSFSRVPQGPLRRLLPANGLPPEALAADTLLNDFRQLTQQGRCCKVLQLLLLLRNSFYPLKGNLPTAIFNTHLNLCFNLFLLY